MIAKTILVLCHLREMWKEQKVSLFFSTFIEYKLSSHYEHPDEVAYWLRKKLWSAMITKQQRIAVNSCPQAGYTKQEEKHLLYHRRHLNHLT